MLADGCEAALRAMNINASDKEALETISNIIYSRQKDGQLDDSNLSRRNFSNKKAFLNVGKELDIEEFSIQLARIILFLNFNL